jgi:Na+-transporting NADH:ubiquinone oxidoreductase subunit NqrD
MHTKTFGSHQPHVATLGTMTPLIPGEIAETIEVTFIHFQYQFKYILSIRSQIPDALRTSMNLLLVTATTSFIESLFSSLLTEICEKAENVQHSEIVTAIIQMKKDEIHSTSFGQYSNFLKGLTGTGFKDYTTTINWSHIEELFKLRNKIAHGEHVSTIRECISEEGYVDTHNDGFESLRQYIMRHKLVSKPDLEANNVSIFTNPVINFLLKGSIPTVADITKKVSERYKLHTWQHADNCFQNVSDGISQYIDVI